MFRGAKKLGNKLIVIVNNDNQVKLKGSYPFMPLDERVEVIASLRDVDDVVISIDDDQSVCKTLQKLKPEIFANGGDRKKENIPEYQMCEDLGIKMVFNVGGGKIQSSSWLIKNYEKRNSQ